MNLKDEYDYIVIGSGFGGSVSALRLSEKGYRVLVVEKGKRYQPADFPKTNWNLPKYLWAPLIRCFGIQKLTLFRKVLVLSGVGVGGGSLVYANTLLEPGRSFYEAENWKELDSWQERLKPFYQLAKRYLGVVRNPHLTDVDVALKEVAISLGQDSSFRPVDVGVFFSDQNIGKKLPDPFFSGQGPSRSPCNYCGGCMVGCRHDGKNTLDKNYLYLAEKLGCHLLAEHEVVNILPNSPDGELGYFVTITTSTRFFKKEMRIKAKGIVMAGGVLGTLSLLFKLRDKTRTLPKISKRLGYDVRTNSEALVGAMARNPEVDWSQGVAISSGFYVNDSTHIEPVRYSAGSSFMRLLALPMVDQGSRVIRPIKMLLRLLLAPMDTFRLITNTRWAESTIIFLVMQNVDNKIRLMRKWGFLVSQEESKNLAAPSFIPEAHLVTRQFAKNQNAIPLSAVNEVFLGIPTTAHILGGCGIGSGADRGVVDKDQRLFSYRNFFVCDGSVIPANLGVNPSLTITAMTEYAMSKIPSATTSRQ